jgi:hypothetical protein
MTADLGERQEEAKIYLAISGKTTRSLVGKEDPHGNIPWEESSRDEKCEKRKPD